MNYHVAKKHAPSTSRSKKACAKEELSACKHFLVDTEMNNGRHKAFNFQVSQLDTKYINEKLEDVFNKMDFAPKINIALGFVLRNVEMGQYRYCYANENKTLFEKSPLLCGKRF